MKYLKKYEEINVGEPEVGDYVIVDVRFPQILGLGIIDAFYSNFFYVTYKIPDGRTYHEIFFKKEIKYWSKNKEELEVILAAKKYNL